MKLGTYVELNERINSIDFSGQCSKVKVIARANVGLRGCYALHLFDLWHKTPKTGRKNRGGCCCTGMKKMIIRK